MKINSPHDDIEKIINLITSENREMRRLMNLVGAPWED